MNSRTKVFAAIFALIVAVVLPDTLFASCVDVTVYDELMRRGSEAYNEKLWNNAHECYRNARKSNPQAPEPWYQLGRVEKARNGGKKTDDAVANFETAADIAPQAEKSFYLLELGFLHLEEPADEQKANREFVKVNDSLAHLLLAGYLLDAERWDEAAAQFAILAQPSAARQGIVNAATAKALQVYVRAWQIYSAGAVREVWWEEAWGALDNALAAAPEHFLANFLAGFLMALPQGSGAPLPSKLDSKEVRERSKHIFEQASVDQAQPIEALLPHWRADELLRERFTARRSWLLERLIKMRMGGYYPPKVSAVGRKQVDNIITGHDHVWVYIKAQDDIGLKHIEITRSWENQPFKIDVEGRHYAKLHRIDLPLTIDGVPRKVQITAIDVAGRSSDRVELTIHKPSPIVRHAFLIGIEDYPAERKIPSLKGLIRNDLEPLYRHLIDPIRGRVNPKNVHVLLNEDATAANLQQVFRSVRDYLTKEAAVLFYFSGHGAVNNNVSCLVTADRDGDRCKEIEELLLPLKRAKVGQITVIFDACHSGDPQALESIRWEGERNILAASAKEEKAKMSERGSLFTTTFLEFLRDDELASKIDEARRGVIRVGQLFEKVRDKIELYNLKSKGNQTVWGSVTPGMQVMGWRPRRAVALEWVKELRTETSDTQLADKLEAALVDPEESPLKSVTVDILTDLANHHIGIYDAWELIKQMEPFLAAEKRSQ